MRTALKSLAVEVWAGWFRMLGSFPLRGQRPASALLLAAPGQGNVGDQAMLESYLYNTRGSIIVVARRATDLMVPADVRDRVRVVELPSLLYGFGPGVARAAVRFRRLLRHSREFAVVGADIMDGAHNVGASVRRFDAVSMAARLGIHARVLGFSWNERPHPAAQRALRRLDGRVLLVARDPLSADRLRAAGASRVAEGADLVFAHPLPPEESTTLHWIRAERAKDRRVLLVNVNSLVERTVAQVSGITPALSEALDNGVSVVVVPHDPRNVPSDVDLADRLVATLGSEHVTAAPLGLTPRQIASLARAASGTISARMHLTILSLLGGLPVVGVSYQGKVEGLFDLMGIRDLCVDPASEFEVRVAEAARMLLEDEARLRALVGAHLPRVRELALANFAGRDE